LLSRYIFFSLLLFSKLLSLELSWVDESHKYGEFAEDVNYKVGTTGIVIKQLSDEYSAIISYAEVISLNRVKFKPFKTLFQENLPRGLWKPEVGDRVRFEENYHRALIIAKNFDDYLTVSKKFSKEWVHPDLFTATLSSIGHRSPLKEDFNYFCREHSIGLVYFALQDGVKKVDCLSMVEIDNYPMKLYSGDEYQKPFYSRIKEIDSNWIGEGINDIPDFEKYYRELIKK